MNFTHSHSLRACFVLLLLAGMSSTAFSQAGSVVTINSDQVLVINGRKVFPIGFSPGPPTGARTPSGRDALDELREAGAILFRTAQTTRWTPQVAEQQQAALDWAQKHGMYCWVNLRELSKFAAGDTNTEAALRKTVNQFKKHPAIGLWKNADEAWWGHVSAADLRRGYDVIRQEDPNHPIVQTHAPRGTLADLQPYNDAADVLALDIYPVGVPPGTHSLLKNKEISMVGDWTQFLSRVANGRRAYWLIEQIAWSGVIPPKHELVFPTFAQERFMAYQAIVNGARGLMYFGGNIAATLNPRDQQFGWNWAFWEEVLQPLVKELGDRGALAEALVAPTAALPIRVSGAGAPEMEFCVREVPPQLYIIACKREGPARDVTFSALPAPFLHADLLYESSRKIPIHDGKLSDHFEPFAVHVYRLAN